MERKSEEYITGMENLDEDEYEFDDLICMDNNYEWHVRAYIGTEAYWVFFYRDCRKEQ